MISDWDEDEVTGLGYEMEAFGCSGACSTPRPSGHKAAKAHAEGVPDSDQGYAQ